MATWNPNNVILTQKGQEILSKVQAGVGKLTVTKVVSGGGYVSPSQLYKQTAVTNPQQTLSIVGVDTDENGSEINCNMSNASISQAYSLYQLGVYVTHQDYTGEQLYLLAQCDTDNPDEIPLPSVTLATLQYSLYMEHSGTTNITVTIDPAGQLTVGMVGKPNGVPGLNADGELDESVIPDTIARQEEVDSKPSYLYVTNNTNLTTVIQQQGTSPFWSLFTSPQGPTTNLCMYIVYPELNSAGASTGNVFIQAYDTVEFKQYMYKGAQASVASTSWMPIGGGGSPGTGVIYATCSTAATTAAKVVSTGIEDFELTSGMMFAIKFAYDNTAASVTLNIDGTGAKNITRSEAPGANLNAENCNALKGVVLFLYDGTSYVMHDTTPGNASTLGKVRLSDSTNSTSGPGGGIAATPAAVKAAYDLANGKQANIATGTTSQYYRGDKTWQNLTTAVMACLLTGLANGSNAAIAATDSLLTALAKLQAQVNAKASTSAVNGKASKVMYTATIATGSWSSITGGYSKTMTVSGILASDTPIVGVVQGSTASTNKSMLENWAKVSRITTAANSITIYCYGSSYPSVSLPIQLLCIR